MEEEIAETERRRYEAMKQADIVVLGEVLDDLLIYAHSNSATDDRESSLAKVQTGYYQYQSISYPRTKRRCASWPGTSSRPNESTGVLQSAATDVG